MEELREECGVFGAWAAQGEDLARLAYYGLFALQHRGQEAAGICASAGGELQSHKGDGLVGEVFTPQVLAGFKPARVAVGHVRYSTTGAKCSQNAQPIVVSHKAGALALAHNGNLTNYRALRAQLESGGSIFHTTSDTEVISYIITRERLTAPTLEHAISRTMGQIEGAYCLVVMNESKLIAVRDPSGYRPLCYGVIERDGADFDGVGGGENACQNAATINLCKTKGGGTPAQNDKTPAQNSAQTDEKTAPNSNLTNAPQNSAQTDEKTAPNSNLAANSTANLTATPAQVLGENLVHKSANLQGKIYVVASETAALDAVGARFVRDIEPGEMLTFADGEVRSNRDWCATAPRKTCAFEFIYFARPDSVIDGVSVHNARVLAGEILAQRHPASADLVIGVPDSGLEGAMGYANKSGLPLEYGFLKNRYIGRTFISPGQSSRENLVSIKLNAIASVVAGKRLVVIDDSIVRGTTSRKTVALLRRAGAREVHMRITAPQFVSPCFWGVDIDSRDNLISCRYTLDEIAAFIGVDSLGFLEIEDLAKLCGGLGHCAKCFERGWEL